MIIGQVTDLHLGFDGRDKPCSNTARLNIVIDSIRGLQRRPTILIATGDLVESGETWAYQNLKEALREFNIPTYMAMGNHDKRDAFRKVFPEAEFNDGFLQYTVEGNPVRIIVLDTLEEGRHGGSFCERRAKWLRARLDEQPDKPTLLALHHPPIATGINWMTADPNSEWVQRLQGVVSDYSNIVHMISGHIHRSIFKKFANTTISVTPAIAPQVKLELAELNLDVPDGRGLLVEGRPGFCLHQWDGTSMTSHTAVAPCGTTILSYTRKNASIVRHTLDMGH